MTKAEAIATLKANPLTWVFLTTRDATGAFFENRLVWLDDAGDLVQSHPTDSSGTCAAPESADYCLGVYV